MTKILECVNQFVWGLPALVLIIGVGIRLSLGTGFAQITLFPKALRLFVSKFGQKRKPENGVTAYQALCTALAATVGTGNIAGVAGAIAVGGPGAIFWMWICGLLGMVTKYAETVLAIRYRIRTPGTGWIGGPMYVICNGLGKSWTWLACFYCFFGIVASVGVGNATQINAVISGVNSVLQTMHINPSGILNLIIGFLLAILISAALSGGARRIGKIAERLVPYAAAGYMILALGILIVRFDAVPEAFAAIFRGAFSPGAVTGGVLGSAFQALRVGASRGVFTNEAGMGTAAIAHSSAEVSHPSEQGLMGIIEVFLDTIVICTMTALVILCSGVDIPYGFDTGAVLTVNAFSTVYGEWISIPLAAALCCFAVATVLGWGLYGTRCAQFLFGEDAWKPFVVLQTLTVLLGAVLRTEIVWILSEITNGLMAVPNLIALIVLSPEVFHITKEYKKLMVGISANGGTYENFDQCQPL